MDVFRKLHERRVAPGFEVTILCKLPGVALFGSLIPAGLAVLARVQAPAYGANAAKHVQTVDIYAIATEITFLTALFTVAIGATFVYIMKGPAYVADAYPVSHADSPARRSPTN